MPDDVMDRFPLVQNHLEALKIPIHATEIILDRSIQTFDLGQNMLRSFFSAGATCTDRFLNGIDGYPQAHRFFGIQRQSIEDFWDILQSGLQAGLKQQQHDRHAELEFLNLFTEDAPAQDWTVGYDDTQVMLDLPGMKVIDISSPAPHRVQNFTVVFAPRAGHHSNIAEKVALFLRDRGLSRMAVVEQKCAAEVPLYVDGKRHREDFASQVEQYAQVLRHLRRITGTPAHLVAICQPGPLLISTLILNPHLARTFGSAGSPMHTDAQKGFLTDFARLAGESYIDRMMALFGRTIAGDHLGSGRECYDGSLQVLGFYYLGADQHVRNFKRLLTDLKRDEYHAVERQKVFYQWYNTAHHFPASFIRDTYKKVFINNDLIRGRLDIGGKTVDIRDYPGSVPIWALGGQADAIAPPLQATAHMDLIDSVPAGDKLKLICDGGHMALFRSKRIMNSHYSRIAEFMLQHSDRTENSD